MSITPILQFGTSRFLQAHVDLFISEAMQQDQAIGPITVVQSSGDVERARRLAALAHPDGYGVRIEGLVDGKPVRQETTVTSVIRTMSTTTDWDEIGRIFVEEVEIVLSNTGDQGYFAKPADEKRTYDQAMSFPAKLALLLEKRLLAGGKPLQIMPTELIAGNGRVLRQHVLTNARRHSDALADWIASDVLFVNSLVDRIVSEPLEPAGAVAEPYALWAIERSDGLKAPCTHPSVQIVDDLGPIERRKLYILNLGHTYLVGRWLQSDRQAQYVRDLMADPVARADLEQLYREEVLPVFRAVGDMEAEAYVATTLDRFANPYLAHKLADIAQNHSQKLERRILAFMDWAKANGTAVDQPCLEQVLKSFA
ncbi:mannitol dehydrogenase family protein [Rhizobium alvei]|uniref:Mannitol dehydrogenase family protein n=1 Tax=Rhizobium alvei TaxID=1132659 RepID=A0ABT8YHJ7_9HYPH|nr:mannitol dehydrogenase family protein [Rhizobium alvei]MDO6963116.1 mannitol dehydrogenase family protein [Rhizobium alvei]